MVEWLTENIPPLHMHKSDPRQLQELKQFYTDISTTLCKTIAFILLWFDGSCFRQCLTFLGKAKSEHFVSLNTGWLPNNYPPNASRNSHLADGLVPRRVVAVVVMVVVVLVGPPRRSRGLGPEQEDLISTLAPTRQ